MILRVQKTDKLNGSLRAPGSKSQSVRALLLASLAKGTSTLRNLVDSEDTEAALSAARFLGAELEENEDGLKVTGKGLPLQITDQKLYTQNSGITTRFVLPLIGLDAELSSGDELKKTLTLDVDEQMRKRPITPLIEALNALGMQLGSGFPLEVSGQLKGGTVQVDGTTSQYLSALLLSLPCAPNDSTIVVENLNERPYVNMTTRWLDEQNIHFQWSSSMQDGVMRDEFKIQGRQAYRAFDKEIPGDFSSASYLLAAQALLPGKVEIKGLDLHDAQPDKALIPLLKNWPEAIDCNDFPDLLPTLAVLATQQEKSTRLFNVAQARIKETDRIHSMTEGLRAMGAQIDEHDDGMTIHPSKLKGAKVHGYGDHRTVMALAIAGLIAEGETEIDTAEGIRKTYPHFVSDLQSLGAKMELIQNS